MAKCERCWKAIDEGEGFKIKSGRTYLIFCEKCADDVGQLNATRV